MLDKCYSIMWMSYHTKGICSSEVHAWFKNFLERGEGYRDMKREHIQNLDFYLCVFKDLNLVIVLSYHNIKRESLDFCFL